LILYNKILYIDFLSEVLFNKLKGAIYGMACHCRRNRSSILFKSI